MAHSDYYFLNLTEVYRLFYVSGYAEYTSPLLIANCERSTTFYGTNLCESANVSSDLKDT